MSVKRKSLSLPVKILIGMILGCLLGIICHEVFDLSMIRSLFVVRFFEIGGNLFLNMFRVIVVPVILVSMMLGTASMNNPVLLGRVGGKTLFCFAATTVISSILGIVFSLFFKIGSGSSIQLPANSNLKLSGNVHSISDTLANIIPANLFQSFIEPNMLQVIVIAVVCGIALTKISSRVPHLLELLKEIEQLNLCIVDFILNLAPAGVFCLLAHTFSCFGFSVLLPLGKYILCFIGVSAVILFVIYPLLLLWVGRLSPLFFYKKMLPVMMIAFSTSSSNATLPSNIDVVSYKLGVSKDISTFILSLGATINMNGTAAMQGCAAILVSQLYNVPLSVTQIIEIITMSLIASIGTAGMPSAGVLMLGLVLQSVGLPISGIALVLGVDRIVDMVRTVVNITGDSVTAVLVGNSEKYLDRTVFYDGKIPKDQKADD